MAKKKKGYYKVIDIVTERICFIGTVDDIAREFNCSPNTVYPCANYGLPFQTMYEIYHEYDEFSSVRRCRTCNKVKPITEFIKKNSKYTCRSCLYEYNKQWRKKKKQNELEKRLVKDDSV